MRFRRPKFPTTITSQKFVRTRVWTCLFALLLPTVVGCQLGGGGFGAAANGTLQPHRAFRQAVVAPGVQSYYRGPEAGVPGGVSSLYPAPVFGVPNAGQVPGPGQPFQNSSNSAGFGALPPAGVYGSGLANGNATPSRRPFFGNVFGNPFANTFGGGASANYGTGYQGVAGGPGGAYQADPYQATPNQASPFPPGYQAGPATNPYFSGAGMQPAYTPSYNPGSC